MHYANGREAHLGDLVVGTAYNSLTAESIAANTAASFSEDPSLRPPNVLKPLCGALVKIVPDVESCNAEIEWIESTDLPSAEMTIHQLRPRMAVDEATLSVTGAGVRLSWRCRDFTHVGALLHVEDVALLPAPPAP